MEKVIIQKFARFIELSNKFIKSKDEVLDKNKKGYAIINGNLECNSISYYPHNQKVEKTDLELLEEECNKKIQNLKDYEEYLKLSKELKEYTNSLLTLIKD